MKGERVTEHDPGVKQALGELKAMISERYPNASFEVSLGEDPEGVYLTASVDVPDTTEVMGVVVDRLIDMQVEQGLPVYVVPVQPLERVLSDLKASKRIRPRANLRLVPPNP